MSRDPKVQGHPQSFSSKYIVKRRKLRNFNLNRFYRAMHFSAKRGIAIACRLSVRPSVRLSVCL